MNITRENITIKGINIWVRVTNIQSPNFLYRYMKNLINKKVHLIHQYVRKLIFFTISYLKIYPTDGLTCEMGSRVIIGLLSSHCRWIGGCVIEHVMDRNTKANANREK